MLFELDCNTESSSTNALEIKVFVHVLPKLLLALLLQRRAQATFTSNVSNIAFTCVLYYFTAASVAWGCVVFFLQNIIAQIYVECEGTQKKTATDFLK